MDVFIFVFHLFTLVVVERFLYAWTHWMVAPNDALSYIEFQLRAYRPVTMHHRAKNTTCGTKSHTHDTHVEFGSESFDEFLGILGEKIRLKGWERFRGGLDVKGKMIAHFFYFLVCCIYRKLHWIKLFLKFFICSAVESHVSHFSEFSFISLQLRRCIIWNKYQLNILGFMK